MNKKNGFTLIELTVVVLVLAVLGAGTYLWVNQGKLSQPQPKQEPSKTGLNPPTTSATPTPLPTLPALETDSSDAVINQTSVEVNQLMQEVNTLDQIETDLDLPEVDFSTDF